jgi:hypothetical protein
MVIERGKFLWKGIYEQDINEVQISIGIQSENYITQLYGNMGIDITFRSILHM